MTQTVINELEYMATELNYYKDKKILKDKEIEAVIKKRKEFELLISSKPRLSIYLLYIEHEVILERIYNRRIKKEKNRKYYIRRRIDNLYRRAQSAFPGETDLFISQLEYFISVEDRKKIRETALNLPKRIAGKPEAWIRSANALRHIGEIEGSRILLQRSLRVLKNKEEVLKAFIEMEEEHEEEDSERIIEILKNHAIKSESP